MYYEAGFNDVKNWYEVGEATLRVSDELEFKNNIYPEKGEQIFYAGSFLVGEVTNYNFTPHNTTIRTENGQIVFMERSIRLDLLSPITSLNTGRTTKG